VFAVVAAWILLDRLVGPLQLGSTQLVLVPVYSGYVTLAALAMLAGLVQVCLFHVRRVWLAEEEWLYSLILLAAAIGVVTMGMFGTQGVASLQLGWVFRWVIAPAEEALMAATFFSLAGAYILALRRRRTGHRWFTIGFLAVLALQLPWLQPLMPQPAQRWLDDSFALFGTPVIRGVLLGTVITACAFLAQHLMPVAEHRSPDDAPAPQHDTSEI
jgi:hypothetical protein